MNNLKYYLITALALLISVAPVIAATLSYFPIWRARGGAALLSGFTLFLLFICAIPLLKFVKRAFASPSILFVWLFVFLLFFCLGKIADEMTVIAFIGFISNTVSALLFKIAKRYRGERV